MARKIINPWTWQDALGFVQANEISGAQRLLFCAGQVSIDEAAGPCMRGTCAPNSTR